MHIGQFPFLFFTVIKLTNFLLLIIINLLPTFTTMYVRCGSACLLNKHSSHHLNHTQYQPTRPLVTSFPLLALLLITTLQTLNFVTGYFLLLFIRLLYLKTNFAVVHQVPLFMVRQMQSLQQTTLKNEHLSTSTTCISSIGDKKWVLMTGIFSLFLFMRWLGFFFA